MLECPGGAPEATDPLQAALTPVSWIRSAIECPGGAAFSASPRASVARGHEKARGARLYYRLTRVDRAAITYQGGQRISSDGINQRGRLAPRIAHFHCGGGSLS
ncbi:hypothetical protein NDU88_001047 [Pleurodeles waltl]|uniref:Uncharacterized protein n=1 Tax=Pleurodeles waltl TaxID=8319 RepID=A0AAV7LZX9_PLEWA|nr:hypothetical protein NDU88_001047 [Pleurodeles waltl]